MVQFNKILFIIFLFSSILLGQFEPPAPTINFEVLNIDLGAIQQGDTSNNSLIATIDRFYRDIDSVTINGNTTLLPNISIIGDSVINAENTDAFIITGDQDSTLIVNADSTYRFSNIPTELNPNPNFDFSYTEEVVTAFSNYAGYDTFDGASATGFHAISDGSHEAKGTTADEISFVSGSVYAITYSISVTSGQRPTFYLRQSVSGGTVYINHSAVSETIYYVATVTEDVTAYLYNSAVATEYTVSNFSVHKLVTPSGFSASTFTATNYIIEGTSGGCKFVEATGTTAIKKYIGNGKTIRLKGNISSYTSGELNAFNGTSETVLGDAVESFDVNTTMTQDTLIIQVDNNSNLTLAELSITEVFTESSAKLPLDTLDTHQFYTLTLNYTKVTNDGKLYFGLYKNDDTQIWVDSTATATLTEQTKTKSFIGINDSTYIKIWGTDSTATKFSITLESDRDKIRVTKDNSGSIGLSTDISTVGSFVDNGTVHTTVGDYPFTVTSEVVYPTLLTIQDSLNFGTPTTLPTDEDLLLINNGINPITILGTSGLSSPFSVYRGFSSVASQDTQILLITFNPFTDDTFVDTLLVETADSTYSIVVTGNSTGITEGTLANTTLSITDSTDGFTLSWEYVANASGYILYQKASDQSNYTAFDTTASLTTTFNYSDADFREYLDFSFYAKAYNSSETANSDTLTASSEVTASNAYFINTTGDNTTGTSIATACTTLAKFNSLEIPLNSNIYIESGEQFSDETYYPPQLSSTYTYGGTDKAILGDSTLASSNYTVTVLGENAEINGIKIYGNASSYIVIALGADGFILKNSEVIGGQNAHSLGSYGIRQTNTYTGNDQTIRNNIIRDLGFGIRILKPYNYEIAYNTMYNFYRLDGRMNYGGAAMDCEASFNGDKWDTEYTLHIHHNDISRWEYVAMALDFTNMLVENNVLHTNLDERIYRGGVKHTGLGKWWNVQDQTTSTNGSLGTIFRDNYVFDIIRYGQAGYIYGAQTSALVLADSFITVDTNNTSYGKDDAVYQYAILPTDALYSYYGNHFGDQRNDVTGASVGEGPDALISGEGWANTWIHNNIFNNIYLEISTRASTHPKPTFRSDLSSYFINNTCIDVGLLYRARYGVINTSAGSNSPHKVINNIILDSNPDVNYAVELTEQDYIFDNNILPLQGGYVLPADKDSYPSTSNGDNYAITFRYRAYDDYYDGILPQDNQYLTDPEWIDTSSTIFASSLGVSGYSIPDVRISESSNAYNTGKDYDLIGDTYTVLGITHEMGSDPTGRSFAYDILGNLRTTNDIGAVGLGLDAETIIETVPTIVSHPEDVEADSGTTITFTVNATGDFVLGYQWWKFPYVSKAESKIVDGDSSKYEGATSNTLTIKNITDEDASVAYIVEVKNMNCYPDEDCFINSNPAYILITNPSYIDTTYAYDSVTVYTAITRDDVYWYSTSSYSIDKNYLYMGDSNPNSNNIFLRFTGITLPSNAICDSAYIIFTSYGNYTTTGCNIIGYGENSNNPDDFDTPTEALSRSLLSEILTLNNIESWYSGENYKIYVKELVDEWLANYTFISGGMAFQFRNNSSSTGAYRVMRAHEGDEGIDPTLKIYYRYIP